MAIIISVNRNTHNTQISFSDFCNSYLKTMQNRLAPRTYEAYQRNIQKRLIPFFGNQDIRAISYHDVQRYVDFLCSPGSRLDIAQQQRHREKQLQRGRPDADIHTTLSPGTIKRQLATLQSIFRLAIKLDYIDISPANMDHLTLPRYVQHEISYFTPEEAKAMIQALQKESLQYQVLIQLAIHLGARKGELLALRFSDVDFARKTIHIRHSLYKIHGQPAQFKAPKDYQERRLFVSDEMISLVERLCIEKMQQYGSEWRDDMLLFTKSDGSPMGLSTPNHWFARFLKRNGFQHRKFHCLRHTSATLLLYAGTDMKTTQDRLGHQSQRMTERYLHLVSEADRSAADALQTILK